MRRFLKKSWHGIPIGIIASVLICTAVLAVGGIIFIIPSHVTVVEPAEPESWEIELYEDAGCTTPWVGDIDFGTVETGKTSEVKIYVKSVGNQDTLVTATCDIASEVGYLESELFVGGAPYLSATGQGTIYLRLHIDASASDGTYDFETTITSTKY